MPSIALSQWQTDRMPRLDELEAHCAALSGASPPETLQGYVMLLSGHFQGFCWDLYNECAQVVGSFCPVG